MDIFHAISTRRSVRTYTTQPVPEVMIDQLLSAAMQAPSAGNQQPWHFIVVCERNMLSNLAAVLPYGKMLSSAPLGIVVCADLNLQKHIGFWVQDCSAAVQNLLLAAHASGLGAVWIGVYPETERVDGLKHLLDLPENVIPLCVVAAGYPFEDRAPVDRFKPERIHYEQW